jgi:hypothetical protein
MAQERETVSFVDLLRWLLPLAVVVLGVVLFFLYHGAAPALGAGL